MSVYDEWKKLFLGLGASSPFANRLGHPFLQLEEACRRQQRDYAEACRGHAESNDETIIDSECVEIEENLLPDKTEE